MQLWYKINIYMGFCRACIGLQTHLDWSILRILSTLNVLARRQRGIEAKRFSLPEQTEPSPANPDWHEQVNEPLLFTHCAFSWHVTPLTSHSVAFLQSQPCPLCPRLHWHRYAPTVSTQVARWWQAWAPDELEHSSIFSHISPSPENPALHLQSWDPSVLVHVAWVWQWLWLVVHSLVSAVEGQWQLWVKQTFLPETVPPFNCSGRLRHV